MNQYYERFNCRLIKMNEVCLLDLMNWNGKRDLNPPIALPQGVLPMVWLTTAPLLKCSEIPQSTHPVCFQLMCLTEVPVWLVQSASASRCRASNKSYCLLLQNFEYSGCLSHACIQWQLGSKMMVFPKQACKENCNKRSRSLMPKHKSPRIRPVQALSNLEQFQMKSLQYMQSIWVC